jgi:hypothetical protein
VDTKHRARRSHFGRSIRGNHYNHGSGIEAAGISFVCGARTAVANCVKLGGKLPLHFPSIKMERNTVMPQSEQFEVLILGSGQGGKLLAWYMGRSGRRTAVVERQSMGGSCPNIACLPSKNQIWSARVAHLAHHAAHFGTATGPVTRQRFAGASATWLTAKLICICRTTRRAAPS